MKDFSEQLQTLQQVRDQLNRVIIGQETVIDWTLMALLSEGHVLLEGVPGLGKTLLIRTLAQSLGLSFGRIQCTPDLMPADVVGSMLIPRTPPATDRLQFEPGPIFANLVLADELNRASPKTQSAFLEAMQEQTVTIAGTTHALPRPFWVMATQNPFEMEGTYPLPESQIDRFFFKIVIDQPDQASLVSILSQTLGNEKPLIQPYLKAEDFQALQQAVQAVVVPENGLEFAAKIVLATQPQQATAPELIRQQVRYGAGPRGAQTLLMAAKARALLQGRFHVCQEDIIACLVPSLRHRIVLNYEGLRANTSIEALLDPLIAQLKSSIRWDSIISPRS